MNEIKAYQQKLAECKVEYEALRANCNAVCRDLIVRTEERDELREKVKQEQALVRQWVDAHDVAAAQRDERQAWLKRECIQSQELRVERDNLQRQIETFPEKVKVFTRRSSRYLKRVTSERDELRAVVKGKDVDLERAFILSSIKTTEVIGLKTERDMLQRDNARLREAQDHWEKARPILIQERETLATKRDELQQQLATVLACEGE